MRENVSANLRRSRAVIVLIALLMAAGSAKSHHASLPEGVTPVEATWLWGHYLVPDTITTDGSPRVYVYPHKDSSRIIDPPWTEVAVRQIKADAKAPAVLVLHGCSGLIRGGLGYRILLMSEGYAIFEPDAFARPGHTCDGSSITMRREEIVYALAQIRRLPWVDQKRIVLMGDSQGGRTIARWDEPGFAAHIILAAGCVWNNGKSRRSPRAPDGVPVLAVMGSEDEFFAGSECQISRDVGGSKSVVIPGAGHDILGHPELKQAVKTFLRACCQ
jgi:dienelactone hydrolase